MPNTLSEELDAVKSELRNASSPDPDLLEMLSRIVHDVTTLTDEEIAEEQETLTERLEEQALVFEAGHPRLAGALRRLVKALSDLGI